MKYELKCVYSERVDNHDIVEVWRELKSVDEVRTRVVEYLDILHHDGIPYEPTLDELRESFSQFGMEDETYIQSSYERMLSGFRTWKDIERNISEMDGRDGGTLGFTFSVKADGNTVITVSATI